MEISKRVEKFIKDCTKNCNNELVAVESRAGKEVISYHEWLTPDEARRAVEIARGEMIEWLEKNIYMYNGECEGDRKEIINDLKQAMKDE